MESFCINRYPILNCAAANNPLILNLLNIKSVRGIYQIHCCHPMHFLHQPPIYFRFFLAPNGSSRNTHFHNFGFVFHSSLNIMIFKLFFIAIFLDCIVKRDRMRQQHIVIVMGRLKTIQENFNRMMFRAKNYHRSHIGWRIVIIRRRQAAITKSSEIVLIAIFCSIRRIRQIDIKILWNNKVSLSSLLALTQAYSLLDRWSLKPVNVYLLPL